MADTPAVVIQSEPRFELIGEPGEFVVYEVDEDGSVLTTAYFATHNEALDQADALAGDGSVRDDTEGEK